MKKQARCSTCLRVTTCKTSRTKARGHTVWYCSVCGTKMLDEPGFQGSEEEWKKYVGAKEVENILLEITVNEKGKRLFDKSYDLPRAPTSAVMISEAKRKPAIKALRGYEEYEERLVRTMNLMREYPTTTEWSFGVNLPNGLFFGFRQKREFAKVHEKEDIEKRKK